MVTHAWKGIVERVHDPVNRISYFLLRCIAFFILQPMLIKAKGHVRQRSIRRITEYLPILQDNAIKAQQLFRDIHVDCASCTANCCKGGFDRFTIYDHITDVLHQGEEYRQWSFRLTPFKPKKANLKRMDEGCPYIGPKGCVLPYPDRPVRCMYEDCSKIRSVIKKGQRAKLKSIRRTFNKVHFIYAMHLLAGGITFRQNDDNRQDTFRDLVPATFRIKSTIIRLNGKRYDTENF